MNKQEASVTTRVGMEPVGYICDDDSMYRGTFSIVNLWSESIPVHPSEQIATLQAERDEALLLLKDHVTLQLQFQEQRDTLQAKLEQEVAKNSQLEKDKTELVVACKVGRAYIPHGTSHHTRVHEAIAKYEVKK